MNARDFTCPYCRAPIGEPCSLSVGHAPKVMRAAHSGHVFPILSANDPTLARLREAITAARDRAYRSLSALWDPIFYAEALIDGERVPLPPNRDAHRMTRFLHESCEHCRHCRVILLAVCSNPICAKSLSINISDAFEGRASYICPLCNAPLIYKYDSDEGFAVELDSEQIYARSKWAYKKPWADLIPRKPL